MSSGGQSERFGPYVPNGKRQVPQVRVSELQPWSPGQSAAVRHWKQVLNPEPATFSVSQTSPAGQNPASQVCLQAPLVQYSSAGHSVVLEQLPQECDPRLQPWISSATPTTTPARTQPRPTWCFECLQGSDCPEGLGGLAGMPLIASRPAGAVGGAEEVGAAVLVREALFGARVAPVTAADLPRWAVSRRATAAAAVDVEIRVSHAVASGADTDTALIGAAAAPRGSGIVEEAVHSEAVPAILVLAIGIVSAQDAGSGRGIAVVVAEETVGAVVVVDARLVIAATSERALAAVPVAPGAATGLGGTALGAGHAGRMVLSGQLTGLA